MSRDAVINELENMASIMSTINCETSCADYVVDQCGGFSIMEEFSREFIDRYTDYNAICSYEYECKQLCKGFMGSSEEAYQRSKDHFGDKIDCKEATVPVDTRTGERMYEGIEHIFPEIIDTEGEAAGEEAPALPPGPEKSKFEATNVGWNNYLWYVPGAILALGAAGLALCPFDAIFGEIALGSASLYFFSKAGNPSSA